MKSIIHRILIVVIIVGFLSFIIIEGLILLEAREKEIDEDIDYVIVLGARLYGNRPSPALKERLKTARDYLIENEDLNVIVSGGQGHNEDIPEAEAMAKYLMDNGIDENRIIKEDKSTSTFENFKFSLDVLRDLGEKEDIEILIVTSDYHLFRSKFLANRLGMAAYGLPAKTPPSIVLSSHIREYFAFVKSFLLDRK